MRKPRIIHLPLDGVLRRSADGTDAWPTGIILATCTVDGPFGTA